MPKVLTVHAHWDPEGAVWWCDSPDIPGLVTEAPSFDALVDRVSQVAPEIIELNGVAPAGAELVIAVTAERSVTIKAAA